MGLTDRHARTECYMPPTHLCSNNRRVKTLHPGTTVYTCLGQFIFGGLEVAGEIPPVSSSFADPARSRGAKGRLDLLFEIFCKISKPLT